MGSIERKMRRDRERAWGVNKGKAWCGHCMRHRPLAKMVTYDVNGRHIWMGCNECSHLHGEEIDLLGAAERKRQEEGKIQPAVSKTVSVTQAMDTAAGSTVKRSLAFMAIIVVILALIALVLREIPK